MALLLGNNGAPFVCRLDCSARFLHLVYSGRASLYEFFRPCWLSFPLSKTNLMRVGMDLVYLGLMAVFYVVVAGFAGACDKLGGAQ